MLVLYLGPERTEQLVQVEKEWENTIAEVTE